MGVLGSALPLQPKNHTSSPKNRCSYLILLSWDFAAVKTENCYQNYKKQRQKWLLTAENNPGVILGHDEQKSPFLGPGAEIPSCFIFYFF